MFIANFLFKLANLIIALINAPINAGIYFPHYIPPRRNMHGAIEGELPDSKSFPYPAVFDIVTSLIHR